MTAPQMTIAEAEKQGFTINRHAAGRPIGYKGSCFMPDEQVVLFTELEERLLEFVKRPCWHHCSGTTCPYWRARRAFLGVIGVKP